MNPARTTMFDNAALAGVGYWHDDELVGFLGAMPMDFNIDGRVVPGLWLCNLLAAPEFLQYGIGLKLMTAVHALPVAVIGAVGINLRVIPMYRALRYMTGDHVPRFLRVLDVDAFATIATGNHWCGLANAVVERTVKLHSTDQVTVHDTKLMDPQPWDTFWANYAGQGYVGTQRDAAYFTWRYSKHPHLHYKMAVARARNGVVLGGAVWRIEHVRDSSLKVVRLIELLGADTAARIALIQHVETASRASGAAIIDHYSTRPPSDELHRCGWFCDSDAKDDVLPSLFQPLVRKKRSMNYAVRIMARAGSVSENAADRLVVVKSDGDQDRPN